MLPIRRDSSLANSLNCLRRLLTSSGCPVDIAHVAARLIDVQAAVYDAQLRGFRIFCAHFNEPAKDFATGPERDFVKHFSTSFLVF